MTSARVAIGLAVAAVVIAGVAVVVVAQRGPRAPATRRVAAGELAKLAAAVEPTGDGVRVVDDAVGAALGLARGDAIVAISGRPVARADDVRAALRELAALAPRSLFVDVVRDGAPVLVRWELDGALAAARPPVDPLIASIARLDATTYELPRVTVEAWAVQAAAGSLGPEGLELRAVAPGSLLAALGLQSGDAIRALNGSAIGADDPLAVLIARATTQLTVDVRRRGQTVILNYRIK